MPNLTQSNIIDFKKTNKQMSYYMNATVNLLTEIAEELNTYGTQQVSDLRQGRVRVGGEYISLELANKRIFVDHYATSYLESITVLLKHFVKSYSILGKWLITRTIMEAIYERARISLVKEDTQAEAQKNKIIRYRNLQVLDFHLNLAQSIRQERWINDYVAMRDYVKNQRVVTEEDLEGFPEAANVLDETGENRNKRANRFQKLSKKFSLPKGDEYSFIYTMISRLAHGNPLQTAVSRRTMEQWREQFLINGIVNRACLDLLKFMSTNIETRYSKKVHRRIASLQSFYSNRLEPGWRIASSAELPVQ